MNVERDKKLLSFIIAATIVIIFALVIGIVIFSLPDTTGVEAETGIETEVETEAGIEIEVETEITTALETEAKLADTDEAEATTTQALGETTSEPVTVSLIAYGDNLLHKGISEYSQQADGSYDFSYIYSDISDEASAADIAVVNEEVVLGGTDLGISGYPNFNAPHEVVDALSASGFDCMTLATNHVLDMGSDGVISMLNYIRTYYPDMVTTGAYLSEEEQDEIVIMEVSGVRIALLNYTYGLNGHSSSVVYVNTLDEEQILADVEKAKEQADYIVVFPHWGEENQLTPTDEQRALAQTLADAGVDLIIGTHPHVVQPMEVLTGEAGNETIVYYSLGNLVSLQHEAANMLGGVAEVDMTFQDGELVLVDYDYSFVVTHWDENHVGTHVYNWEEYTPELANEHGILQYDATFSYDYLASLVSSVAQ